MLGINDFVELNEAFNSEPYPVEYEVYAGSSERYYFEEDATRKYKIEINKTNRTVPLGRDVRTLWISHKTTGANYRPVIGKFKDPRRVIATVLDILNKYKEDGRFGSRTKGFAIRLQGQNFGAYAGFINKIAKMYLRQQFDVKQEPVYDSENDANLVLINRKGTQFENVFSDYVDWANAALTGNVAVTEPGSEQTTQDQEEQQETATRFKVGDIIAREPAVVYLKITDIETQNGTLYYVVDRFLKIDNSVDSTGAHIPVYRADDPSYTIYTPIATNFIPNNDLPNGTWLVKRTASDSGIYACQIIDADKSSEITEYKIKCYGRYRNELATGTITSREIGGSTWIISEREPHFLDVPNTVVPKFKVDDVVSKPEISVYLHITAVELRSGVMSYKIDEYSKADHELTNSDLFISVATIDSMGYEIYSGETASESEGTKWKVGDVISRPGDGVYYHITAIEPRSGVMSYKTDGYFTVDNARAYSDLYMSVATVDSMDYEIYARDTTTTEPSGPKWQVGDFIRRVEDATSVNVYAQIIAIDHVGGVPTYVYDMFNIRDNVGTGRGRTEVSTLDAVPFVRHEKQKFVVGDTIQNANNTARFLKITDVRISGADLMYTYDVYLVESPTQPRSTSLSLSTSEIDPLYELFTVPVAQPAAQQPSVPDANTPVFSVGSIISRVRPAASNYYYQVLEVITDTSRYGEPQYKLKGFKKSSRRHNRSLDGLLRFSIAHHGYDIYDPRSEVFRNLNPHLNATVAPVAPTPTTAPAVDNSGLIVVPNDVGAPFTTAGDIVVPSWYRVTLDGYSYYAFAYSKEGSRIQERQYTLNGDILSSGELTFRNFGEGDSYQRLDGPPVFKDSSEPHRFKVGDVFSLYGEEYTVIGFRGKFYILNDVSNFKEIKIADRDAVAVQTSIEPQPAQNATPTYPVKTREEHMADFTRAQREYGVVVESNVVEFMIRRCPAATVYDICAAMFGESKGTSGSRRIFIRGEQITATQSLGEIHGAPLENLTRVFKFDDGYVYHDYLKMKPSSQGGGATKKLFTESIPLYEKMGFKKVKVYANIQVGAAIWSKYGFKSYNVMSQPDWEFFISNAIRKVNSLKAVIQSADEYDTLHDAELQGIINLLNGFKQSGYFSDYPAMMCSLTVPNVEALFQKQIHRMCSDSNENLKLNIGKMLMWGNGYRGELDLSDRKSYNRMARYVGLSTR